MITKELQATLNFAVGGFGGLLIGAIDWPDASIWERSMRLFATAVMPRIADLGASVDPLLAAQR